ncbi:MAG: hypothetical protein U0931_35620 [Vulcanimicrobiota bacterium]
MTKVFEQLQGRVPRQGPGSLQFRLDGVTAGLRNMSQHILDDPGSTMTHHGTREFPLKTGIENPAPFRNDQSSTVGIESSVSQVVKQSIGNGALSDRAFYEGQDPLVSVHSDTQGHRLPYFAGHTRAQPKHRAIHLG